MELAKIRENREKTYIIEIKLVSLYSRARVMKEKGG